MDTLLLSFQEWESAAVNEFSVFSFHLKLVEHGNGSEGDLERFALLYMDQVFLKLSFWKSIHVYTLLDH